MKVRKLKYIKPLPVLVYFSLMLFLTISGILVSFYLAISHFKNYTDIGHKSFCAISKAINCDTVAQSPYSIFLGVPVSIWGIVGYFLILVILLFSLSIKENKMRALSTLMLLGVLYSTISLYFGIISAVKIHSYCIMCIATYVINFMLLYMFWFTRRRYEKESYINTLKNDFLFWKTRTIKIISLWSIFIILCFFLILFFPHYWKLAPSGNIKKLKTGFTQEGYPWIGAENPELTIVEFTDYKCFQCKKMHFFLRTLASMHPGKLRLIHRHFPMDHEFNPIIKKPVNPGSGILALIAICASEENKFWDVNDLLYNYDMSRGAIYLKEIAESANLNLDKLTQGVNDPLTKQKLYKDILAGLKKGINGTPTYIINDQAYIGNIPKQILDFLEK